MSVRTVIAYVLLFSGMTACLILAAKAQETRPAPSGPSQILLVSHGRPDNVGLYGSMIQRFNLVESETELEAAVSASTRVIIIDRSVQNDLSAVFLADQLARGVYIVGLNISNQQLDSITDLSRAYVLRYGSLPRFGLTSSQGTPGFASYFTLVHLEGQGGREEALGRLDIRAGLFQSRLARAVGLQCRELVPWSDCRIDVLAK